MDVFGRQTDCDGQAADAVSAYTQVKMEDVLKLRRIPKSGCPDIWIRLPRHKWPKSWEKFEHPVALLERNCTVVHYLDCYGKGNSSKLYQNLDGNKYRIGTVYVFTENKDYSDRYTWMTSKLLERNRI